MKELEVWSAGDESAKTSKKLLKWNIASLILCGITHMMFFFIPEMSGEKVNLLTRLGIGFCLGAVFSVMTWVSWMSVKSTKGVIKRNRLIKFYLYPQEEFVKLGKIPDGKKIIFADPNGVVLCDYENAEHCRDVIKYTNHTSYWQFEEMYEKKYQ